MLDVFAIAKTEERGEAERAWFVVDPAVLYPAALAHVAAAVKGPRPANPLGQLYDRGEALPFSIWSTVATTPDRAQYEHGLLPVRADALEIARLWFTEMLHTAQAGRPLGIHITRAEAWRL